MSDPIFPAAHLNLAANAFDDNLPAEIGNFESITTLILTTNKFSGPIPVELGALSTLRKSSVCFQPGYSDIMGPNMYSISIVSAGELYLDSNSLDGAVPAELGGLTNIGKLS
jgi:hypothetical protein